MKLTMEEKDIIKMLILHELDYYDYKEDFDELDEEFVAKLKTLLSKIERGER